MAKITKTGDQYRINIPKDVILHTGWDENTEVTIVPYLKDPADPLTKDTPIMIKKIQIVKTNGRH
jgi:hypothetical protein